MTKRIWAMVLALVMCVSLLAACGGGTDATTKAPEADTTAATTAEATTKAAEPETTAPEDEPAEAVDTHHITAVTGDAAKGEISHAAYKGEAGKDYTDEAQYTYNDYIADTSTLNWNPLSWETSDDSALLEFVSSPFYSFVLHETKDGWAVVPELAADYATDVTADYVGQFGIQAGDEGRAFKIPLKQNLKWEDGTPINADDFIYSYQQLIDPQQLNRRADSLYAGEYAIAGAKAYFYQGQVSYNDLFGAVPVADLVKNDDGTYSTADGLQVFIGLYVPLDWTGGDTLGNYVDGYGADYFDVTNWDQLKELAGEEGVIPLTDENMELFLPVITGNPAWGETEDDFPNYLVAAEGYPDGVAFEDTVGIIKTGDYELVLIYTQTLDNPDYDLAYADIGNYLVNKTMFDSLKVETDGAISNTYGTTKETTMSCGPYRMDYFEQDKKITFVRNDNWYGYSDGEHEGTYQIDTYTYQVINKHETQLLAFLNGEVDGVALQSEDMAQYGSSPYIRYTPQSYTTKLTFNTDAEALAERGAQVLANTNFRKAFSLAIDRNTFAQSYTSAGSAGYGFLNYMYIYNPFTGETYRDSDPAKMALCELYGITWGEDGDYDDLDEAYDAITGYDMDQAQEIMKTAYDECVADGLYDGTSDIKITLSVYQSDDIYVKMFNYLNEALQNACKGTGFEGKVALEMKVDADYYDTMESGATDIIFSTWGGAAYSPFTILYQCYVKADTKMEYGFEPSTVPITLTVNGKEYTSDLGTWALWMDGSDETLEVKSDDGSETLEKFVSYDSATKCAFLGALENEYLNTYVVTPMYYRNTGSLVSQKGDFAVQEYVDLVSFGGIRYYTFNYNDTEWAEAAKTLTY